MTIPLTPMPFLFRTVGVLLAILAASACQYSPEVEIHNNSGAGILVTVCGKNVRIGDGMNEFLRPYCGQLPPKLEISIRRGAVRSDYVIPIEDFARRQDLSRYRMGGYGHARVQVEPAGTILAVPADSEYPIAPTSSQPAGFPLGPIQRETMHP